jgi:hypothetical protein
MEVRSVSLIRETNRSVYILFFLSICYLAYLASTIQPGVFYSADGGCKYMIVKQLAEGHGFKYLYLPQPRWVHNIWADGFFPLKPPFLYPSAGGYLFVFPPAFQILSSFFYSKFGNPGLYIIPLGCMLLFWTGMILLLRRCAIAPSRIALGLFVLVFCSPLTIYGATYWEHMPAVLLLLSGLAFLVASPSNIAVAAGMGLLSGLAAWFRPEAMMMNVLYGLALAILYWKERRIAIPVFLAGMAAGIGSFLLFNKIEFGSFLGIHGYQVVQDEVEGGTVKRVLQNLEMNNVVSIHHFAYILLLLPVVYVLWKYKKKLDIRTILLIGIVLVYCIATPLMVPNYGGRQWGARYFLPTIPVAILALLLVEKEWDLLRSRRMPIWLTGVILLFTVFCFYRNTYKGGIEIFTWENHHRISPSLDFINRQSSNVVIVSEHYIAMELGYLFDQKYFFLAPSDSSLNRLLPLLKQQGIRQYTYIYDAHELKNRPAMLHDSTIEERASTGDFFFREFTIQ